MAKSKKAKAEVKSFWVEISDGDAEFASTVEASGIVEAYEIAGEILETLKTKSRRKHLTVKRIELQP